MPVEVAVAVVGLVGVLVTTVGAVVVAALNRTHGVAKDARKAATAAEQARDYARPTGNGFAEDTTGALSRIEGVLGVVVARQDEQGRDIGGIRSELRALRAEDTRLHQRITDEIQLHHTHTPKEN